MNNNKYCCFQAAVAIVIMSVDRYDVKARPSVCLVVEFYNRLSCRACEAVAVQKLRCCCVLEVAGRREGTRSRSKQHWQQKNARLSVVVCRLLCGREDDDTVSQSFMDLASQYDDKDMKKEDRLCQIASTNHFKKVVAQKKITFGFYMRQRLDTKLLNTLQEIL